MSSNANRRRPAWCVPAALSLAFVALAACTTNPATGRNSFTGFMSPEQELQIGAEEHPKILATFGGAYDDAGIAAYVDEVGQRLARNSDLPELKFTFTVLDSSIVNAFALPGGYVYVSRGLLALARNEAELAGVLAHEIGHVTARHSAQRYSQTVIAGLGANVLGVVVGAPAGQLAQLGAASYLSAYSRDQEFEADTLGVRYLSRTGYDSVAMATFLSQLQAEGALRARASGRAGPTDRLNLMSTHPRTGDRVAAAIQTAQTTGAIGDYLGPVEYLRRINGVVYGDSPKQGFVRGREFAHPELGFRFEVPPEFTLSNGVRQVVARGPSDAIMIFDGAPEPFGGRMTTYLHDIWARNLSLGGLQMLDIGGLDAATGSARIIRGNATMDLRLVAIRLDGDSIFRFAFLTPPALTERLSVPLRRTTFSFRRLTTAEAASLKPLRISIEAVDPGEDLDHFTARMALPRFQEEWFQVLNGLAPARQPRVGSLVKVVAQ